VVGLLHGGERGAPKVRDWQVAGPREKSVDVLFVGDGYVESDLTTVGKYWVDVDRYAKRLLEYEPFAHFKKRFNVRALLLASRERGCDSSADVNQVDTALDCRFDTKEGRLLTFHDKKKLAELVEATGPTDVVFVMVNTERYGGAGTVLSEVTVRGRPLPAPTFSAQDTTSFLIAVHELGHSFADLADEYEDEKETSEFRLPKDGKDLGEANVTLAGHFDESSFKTLAASVKWSHFLALPDARKRTWLFEGGYYRKHGVFRPWRTCRMRDHGEPFCPVCEEELAKAIVDCCGDKWDDAAWHKERPLSSWK
jgi:hypothetical protein